MKNIEITWAPRTWRIRRVRDGVVLGVFPTERDARKAAVRLVSPLVSAVNIAVEPVPREEEAL